MTYDRDLVNDVTHAATVVPLNQTLISVDFFELITRSTHQGLCR